MKFYDYSKLYFAVEENTTRSTDVDPAISIDHVNRIVNNIDTLTKALGITAMKAMPAGNVIKRYKTTVTKGGRQPEEGDIVPLTKVERKPLAPITLELTPYRKLTTAQAIQKTGRAIALDETDTALMEEIQKDVRNAFFTMLTAAGATDAAGGKNLQNAVAQAWGSLAEYYNDKSVTSVFFINSLDMADYLGSATITTQNVFGVQYLENFLGLGNAFVTPLVPKGSVYATARENLNGAYADQSGDIATSFDLTYDESGMVGMTHSRADDRASIQTLVMSGVVFYTEDAAGVIKSDINPEA